MNSDSLPFDWNIFGLDKSRPPLTRANGKFMVEPNPELLFNESFALKLNCNERIYLYSLHLSCIFNKICPRIAEYFLRMFCSFSKAFIFNDSL